MSTDSSYLTPFSFLQRSDVLFNFVCEANEEAMDAITCFDDFRDPRHNVIGASGRCIDLVFMLSDL